MSHLMEYQEPRFTYGDYVKWEGDERWELIDGEAYLMSPAPTERHQRLAGRLHGQLFNQLEGHPCIPYFAPLDVRLPEGDEADEEIRTVVQPDVLIVCDEEKIDEKGVRGAPDFVLEILSPATTSRDMVLKAELYEKHGVREYWVIDPNNSEVVVHRLGEEGKWQAAGVHTSKGTLKIEAIPGLEIDLDRVFQ